MVGWLVDRLYRLQIDEVRCKACRRCLASEACRMRAIVRLEPGDVPFLDLARCYDCRVCMPACPFQAIYANLPGEFPHLNVRH